MIGQYIRSTERQLISEEDTFLWLSRGDLNGETGSEIIAPQDRALQKQNIRQQKYYRQKETENSDYAIMGTAHILRKVLV
jgi:hypothetical protein